MLGRILIVILFSIPFVGVLGLIACAILGEDIEEKR